MKPKMVAGLIISKRKADGGAVEQPAEGTSGPDIDACSAALIRAVGAKDAAGVSAAIKDAFEILNSSQDSGESAEASPHSYDAQNALAAKSQG